MSKRSEEKSPSSSRSINNPPSELGTLQITRLLAEEEIETTPSEKATDVALSEVPSNSKHPTMFSINSSEYPLTQILKTSEPSSQVSQTP